MSVCLSVCLSVRPITSLNMLWFLTLYNESWKVLINLVCLSVRLSLRTITSVNILLFLTVYNDSWKVFMILVCLFVWPHDNFWKYSLIFNTLQRKLKSVNDFGLSVCLSVRTITSVNIIWFLTLYIKSWKVLMTLFCLSVCLSVRPPDNFLKYALIFNTLQRKLKSVNDFSLSVCLSVCPSTR